MNSMNHTSTCCKILLLVCLLLSLTGCSEKKVE